MPTEKEGLVEEKFAELKTNVLTRRVFTESDFSELLAEMRERIKDGNHPTEKGVVIEGDKTHYGLAVNRLERELTPHFKDAEKFYRSWGRVVNSRETLIAKAADVSKKLGEMKADKDDYEEFSVIASIVARRYETEFLAAEVVETQEEKRWFLELWPTHYRDYRAKRDAADDVAFDEAAFFDERTKKLGENGKGWRNLTQEDNPVSLRKIFESTYDVESSIINAEVSYKADRDLDPNTLKDIKTKLDELKDVVADTGVAETKVLHNRLAVRYDNLEREWSSNIGPGYEERAKGRLVAEERTKFGAYTGSLKQLQYKLSQLSGGKVRVESPANINSTQKKELDVAYKAVKTNKEAAGSALATILPEDEKTLDALHQRLINEAEVLLGIETEELKSVFNDDVDWWMFAYHGEQWRVTQRLWEQHMADNSTHTLMSYDKKTIKELIKYFSKEIKDLDLDKDDVAYHQRFIALDIQLNRLEKISLAIEKDEKVQVVDKNEVFSEHRLPDWFEVPENTDTAWQQAYEKAAKEHGPNFLRSQVKYLTNLSEGREIQDKSWANTFHSIAQYHGLQHAMEHYHGEDEKEINELAIFLEMREKLFEAQAGPGHGLSMTCDMDVLHGWEANGILNEFFDYWTMDDNEVETMEDHEKKYRYSHQLKKMVQVLKGILLENPDPGSDMEDRSPFNKDGSPKKGRFGFYYWKDTPANAADLKARMQYELQKNIDSSLSDEDAEEVVFFAHRVATLCGIRLDCFAPYMAAGATPVETLGKLSKYIGEVNIFAPELYSAYKKRIYLQLAEAMAIPEDWWQMMKSHKKANTKRMASIRRAYKASKLVCESISMPREPFMMPIAADGVNIKNTYFSLLDIYFDDEVRKGRRKKGVTLKAWQAGKEEFVSFRKMCFDIPGLIDIDNIGSLTEEKVIEKLVGHVDLLINTGLSYMKKNFDMAQWREMALLTRWGIDRCFRVYALKNDSDKGQKRLLREVRALLDQANTILGAGKKYPSEVEKIDSSLRGSNMDADGTLSQPLDPITGEKIKEIRRLNNKREYLNDKGEKPFTDKQISKLEAGARSFSFSENQSRILKEIEIELVPLPYNPAAVKKLEDAGAMLSYFAKENKIMKVVDARDFLLDSYPNWKVIGYSDGEGNINLSLNKPVKDELTMDIIGPDVDELMSWVMHFGSKFNLEKMTSNLLTEDEFKLFKRAIKLGIFGIKGADQQADPDDKKDE
ncbi:MAG: hypothetical protein HN846_03410 [Candidatus Pacebacteria bacterium]|jgi:hypothetical protein|nr:hypothetical protein [Candidatus Paceibacterota bacterium]MBT3512135.1 hypothetical protein [Candidatus Paceibacterota bacterium]MBT4005403.1 hypothetical protein [Candidatus Paceibacterota bacterium]MBT4359112.1 hypothetical protein [Candidatus Paceibacterota bacterium]MBT4680971.1 hypothetical protein [Candidatus Paceibacterota bacterium]